MVLFFNHNSCYQDINNTITFFENNTIVGGVKRGGEFFKAGVPVKEDINNTDIIREKELGVLPLGVNPLTFH